MNLGYGEASRQFIAIQSINNREFDKNRERHRGTPEDWALGGKIVKNAIFMGELSCHTMIGSDELTDFNRIPNYDEFKIRSLEVIDEDTGESYPFVRIGDDFIAYNPYLDTVHERRFIKIIIKHKGCVPLDSGCTAVTEFIASYKPSHHRLMGFTRINLAVRYYDIVCSFFGRFFNFWPFN
ncbi:unnamed protein product [Caenorhabditis sp. 36 PRJEB53466]|nr:unnamed protein product [Caenorhabditis sp. 36 PRJEB53466]